MKNIIIIFTLCTIMFSCKTQKVKNETSIFTQYCEEAMYDSNLLILNFIKIDSIKCKSLLFKNDDFYSGVKNCGIKNYNSTISFLTFLHKKIDLPTKEKKEVLFVYKDKQIMEIHLTIQQSGTYNHSSYIHSIPFAKGKYKMDYTFPSKYENLEENLFYKDMPKDYFENKQEEIDFSNLKFNYINFSKDRNKFIWKKEE
ncbi:hypothetical protein [Tenacibaculum maritimum]|uniref:hypothetical protein n=1 Tax=Tenacibaculum maritimum TaxID=107401 RepID=UPI00388D2112